MKLTNKDLRRIIKEELTNVLQEKGSTSNAADETIEALELMGALVPSLRKLMILFNHPEGYANPSARPSSIEEAIETMLMHKDGMDPKFLETIGQPRFSRVYFKAAMPLLDHVETIMDTLPEAERFKFFKNSPETVVMLFSVPNRFDGGRGTPSIEFRIYTGNDRTNHQKVVEFKGDALKNDSTLYSLIEAFQNQDQATIWDWANQQLQGV